MAIMNEEVRETGHGHNKQVDAGAIDMILDNLQRSQYRYPIPSTTRELACNGIDSVVEKQMAISILTGKAKVEDFFVEREGALYKDSKWDPSYYDLNWLSNENFIEIRYIVGGNMAKDLVQFTDYGVGLGGSRLEGYFKLGYSSKRLANIPIGKFGIGAKAPLSTDVNFFTMESFYNGKRFKFNIYNSTYDSIIPKVNLKNATENQFVTFNTGTPDEYKVYWEPTTEKNHVIVSLETKKHHKLQYIDAVQKQLLYFENINFIVEENGKDEHIKYRANILFQNDNIILSDNQYWSKPHMLLNKVNYGYIDFDELELEDKNGNIGIKVSPESVDTNPSRESLRWNEKTKTTILERFGTVVDIATKLLQDELSGTDFIQWLRTCYTIHTRTNSRQDIIGRLAKVADLSGMKPKFLPDPRIKFESDVLEGLYMRTVSYSDVRRNNQSKTIITRKEVRKYTLGDITLPIFILGNDERMLNRKDKYLLTLYPTFLAIYEPFETLEKMADAGMSEEFMAIFQTRLRKRTEADDKSKPASVPELFALIKASAGILNYADIEVPENFSGTEEEVDEELSDEAEGESVVETVKRKEIIRITAEERRKLEGKILVYTPRIDPGKTRDPKAGTYIDHQYTSQKIEVPIKSINDWDAEEIYYCTETDDELMHLVAMLTRDRHPDNRMGHYGVRYHSKNSEEWKYKKWWRLNKSATGHATMIGSISLWAAFQCQHFFDANECILVKVAQGNIKYVRDFLPIQSFFTRIKNNKITMSNLLIKWNTARLVQQRLSSVAFLYNFHQFNQEFANRYAFLTGYVDLHYREVDPKGNYYGMNMNVYENLIAHLDNVQQLQDVVRKTPEDTKTIAALAQGLFGNPHLTDGMAVDPGVIKQLEELLEYGEAIGTMLNYIPVLTGQFNHSENTPVMGYKPGMSLTRKNIPFELEQDIKAYLSYKDVLEYGKQSTSLDEGAGNETGAIPDGTGLSLVVSPIPVGAPVPAMAGG